MPPVNFWLESKKRWNSLSACNRIILITVPLFLLLLNFYKTLPEDKEHPFSTQIFALFLLFSIPGLILARCDFDISAENMMGDLEAQVDALEQLNFC